VQRVGERFLAEIISTVASWLDPEEVLDSVVRLLSAASAVHACFVARLGGPVPGVPLAGTDWIPGRHSV
jgi:hypothetical protein